MAFDLARFRGLAFETRAKPDHPIDDIEAARRIIAELPSDEPAKALAEITHWVVSINDNESFSPELRAGVLMEMDIAAHVFWRPLGEEFLAPGGLPSDGKDGDPAILQALQESAAEFANGFALCLASAAIGTRWIRANLLALALRRGRWLTRKMVLSRMLNLPGADERWTELNAYYRFAVAQNLHRTAMPVFPSNPRTSSPKQEYARMLLVDITRPDRMLGRDIEFAFRIIGRVAANVRLESEPLPNALHVVVPEGAQRPVALSLLAGNIPGGALYIDASNALPRLRALLEREIGLEPSEPDPAFGMVFTLRERRALINGFLDKWAARVPARRAQRIRLKSDAAVLHGFDAAAGIAVPIEQGARPGADRAGSRLRIQFDAQERRAAIPQPPARAVKGEVGDASTTGLGIAVPRKEARWAKLGALVTVSMPPAPGWVIGVVRRMNADEQALRMGISVLSRAPGLVWFHLEESGYASVWDEEKRRERNFDEHIQRGILLDKAKVPLEAGEMLVTPGLADRGTRFDLPLAEGMQRLVVTAVREATHEFQRVAFEPQGITPYPEPARPGRLQKS